MADTWFKCEPTQFLLGMNRLATPEQALVYVVVCFKIYEANGPVPNDASAFVSASRLGVRKVRKAIDELLDAGKLYLENGELMNARAASELDARAAISTARSKAGKAGGRPANSRSTDGQRAVNRELPLENSANSDGSSSVQREEMAENSHSRKANAFPTRAREDNRDNNTPLPPDDGGRNDGLQPGLISQDRYDQSDRLAQAFNRMGGRDRYRDDLDDPETFTGVSISDLTAKVMQLANMAVPPVDIVLVGSWVRLGLDPETEILPVVARMAGSAKSPIRAMRYFDGEIRRQHDARNAKSSADSAYFQSIVRKHTSRATH